MDGVCVGVIDIGVWVGVIEVGVCVGVIDIGVGRVGVWRVGGTATLSGDNVFVSVMIDGVDVATTVGFRARLEIGLYFKNHISYSRVVLSLFKRENMIVFFSRTVLSVLCFP